MGFLMCICHLHIETGIVVPLASPTSEPNQPCACEHANFPPAGLSVHTGLLAKHTEFAEWLARIRGGGRQCDGRDSL